MTNQSDASNPKCPQCGYYHPPVSEGQTCPLATQKDSEGKNIDISEEIVQIKNILITNIQKKSIKDHKKFAKKIITKLNKEIETYEED